MKKMLIAVLALAVAAPGAANAMDVATWLTRAEALRGFTRDAAWSLFLEHETGALEVGRRADLVVWASDPMTATAPAIQFSTENSVRQDFA